MTQTIALKYEVKEAIEINLSNMPFITNGGFFIPTNAKFALGDQISLELILPGREAPLLIEGKVVWITPKNAIHHVSAGIGIQFTGENSATIVKQIEGLIDSAYAVGGYSYGITGLSEKR